jgi:hypothetical protein
MSKSFLVLFFQKRTLPFLHQILANAACGAAMRGDRHRFLGGQRELRWPGA